ncbi:MAG: aldo/keto reductase [Phreatobacter sp.]|uniref:aldo/keto reductase n=1 Tax=Phreatobacter sp. TaxID=1966341 RepID=UPI001A56C071|nr:aldo/keto reductase [Phreatobacter sp.]MBL8571805.1 aldo/keto reductase [Phreatobacter sp.]
MKSVVLPSHKQVPALGQGTWQMAENGAGRQQAITALQLGVDLGMTLVDTAEMYGEGAVEELVGEAIVGRRDQVFLVSKVYPHNASRERMVAACARSLKRLRTDRVDLYLLHWPGSVPIDETLETFMRLKDEGKILDYGISNFDARGLQRVWSRPGGAGLVTNQVLYNLSERGIEWDLLPWCRKHSLPLMAYTPLGQGEILGNRGLARVAARHGITPAQAALAWLLQRDGVIAIPKAGNPSHVRENRKAADLELSPEDLRDLDAAFPPPTGPTPLAVL